MASEEDRRGVARKLLLWPLAAWAVLAAVGFYPTRFMAGSDGLHGMLLAQSLVAVVTLATLVQAMRMMVGRSPAESLKIAMLAGVVRFLVTVVLLAVIAVWGRVQVTAFLLWGALAYVALVLVEAVALVRWSGFLESEKRC